MSEVHDHPVETAAVEPAPAADGTSPAVDTKHINAAVKKSDKLHILKKFKAIFKKMSGSKKHTATTSEEPAADAPAEEAPPIEA